MDGDFRLDAWLVQPGLNSLSRNGTTTQLEPKVMAVLVCLAKHAGEPVSKESLLHAVWPNTFVGEGVLARSIFQLRRALEDEAKDSHVIQTIPKHGYRLVASVHPVNGQPASNAAIQTVIRPGPARAQRSRALRWVTVLGSALSALLVFRLWIKPQLDSRPEHLLKPVVLASFAGDARPALSPDGSRFALSFSPESSGLFDLYLGSVGSEQITPLTNHPVPFPQLASWSPDGRWIAFIRQDDSMRGLYLISAAGGLERKLASLSWRPYIPDSLSWSSDNQFVVVPDRIANQNHDSIFMFSATTGERRLLTTPPPGVDDTLSAISPDRHFLAFIRCYQESSFQLVIVPLPGGQPSTLDLGPNQPLGITWTPDNKSIIFAGERSGIHGIWRIGTHGESPSLLLMNNEAIFGLPTVVRGGKQLVFWQVFAAESIYRADRVAATLTRVSNGNLDDFPQLSPDGQHIAFQSKRSGFWEIWMMDSQGHNATQLTHLAGLAGYPRWAPDSRRLVFDLRDDHASRLYWIDVQMQVLQPLQTGSSKDETPFWSRDGKWIYFASNRQGVWQIRKLPVAGGESIQLTHGGGYAPQEASDGSVYYVKSIDDAGIWRVDSSGAEHPILPALPAGYWANWMATPQGIYFIDIAAKPSPQIELFDFATQQVIPQFTLPTAPPVWTQGLTLSSDGRSLLFAQPGTIKSEIASVDLN